MMNTAQILYQQYQVLPKQIRKELKALIDNDEEIEIPLKAVEQGLKEVKLIQQGILPKRTFADIKRDIANGE